MPKSQIRWSRASGTTKRRIERIIRMGDRAIRRQFVAADRRAIKEGGHYHE